MIKVNVEKDKIEIIGHSDYGDLGKDIVCSAVSSIMITTINAIYKMNLNSIEYIRDENNSMSTIIIKKNDEVTLKLLENMVELLKSLEKDYPKNIKVKES